MTMTDPLADMLTRIRNGLMAERQTVRCPDSRLRRAVLEVLRQGGPISGHGVSRSSAAPSATS